MKAEPLPYFRRSGKAIIAEAISVQIAGHDILIAAAAGSALRHVLNGIAPDIDWNQEQSYPVRIAFVEPKPTDNGQLTTDKPA